MGQGVACTGCGASTPLPDDLRVPTFRCAFCGIELSTVAYAGEGARAADEMRAYFGRVLQSPNDLGNAPRVPSGPAGTRAAPCQRCSSPVAVPLDLRPQPVVCPSCGHTALSNAYVSDTERLQLDMARQMAGNAELRALRANGLDCKRCGGHNDVADDGSVQMVCKFCKQTILFADYVSEHAVARSRLKHAALDFKAQVAAQSKVMSKRDKLILWMTLIVVILIGGGIVLANVLK